MNRKDNPSGSAVAPGRADGGASEDIPTPSRPAELQDALNARLYHPLAYRLASRLAPTRVTPDQVSVAGALLIVLAAAAYVQPIWPWSALAGLLLHMGWHVLDGADGDLARMTGRSSPRGEVIDGACDYAGHIVLYVTLGILLMNTMSAPAAWTLAIGAGASRIVQANFYEVRRRQYEYWVYDKPWLGVHRDRNPGLLGVLGQGYLKLSHRHSAPARAVDLVCQQGDRARDRREVVRRVSRREIAPILPLLTPLSANYRTLALGASMLAGSPAYYFLYEIAVLNVLMLWVARRIRKAVERVLAEAAPPHASARR